MVRAKKIIGLFVVLMCLSWIFVSISLASEEEGLLFYKWDASVITASQESEPLIEAPVIVNVITREMIERMGAKSLKDVLITIPGFTFVQDHNEVNVGMRGIYGSSQQKFLVLRDGHRLNSRCYSEANPDYSITLANVKRIEVLRGPGSSLYGDVALTAVVNIITQDGADIDGTQVSVGAGNYGQAKADVVYGKKITENEDLMMFASFYRADGEKIDLERKDDFSSVPRDSGSMIVDGFGPRPSYDIGFKYKTGDYKFSLSQGYCAYVAPRGMGGGIGQIIDLGDYRQFFEQGPGSSSKFTHAEFEYTPKVGNIDLSLKHYYDDFNFIDNEIQTTPLQEASGYGKGYCMWWYDFNVGLTYQGTVPYTINEKLGKGSLLAGIQLEYVDVYDTDSVQRTATATNFNDYRLKEEKVMTPGEEKTYAAFMQIKHKLRDNLIFNGGLRYDYRQRPKGEKFGTTENVDSLSPRVALIYLPNEKIDTKISYTKSFVDAPYWYRYNASGSGGYQGSTWLEPEIMNSTQLSIGYKFFENLTNRLNLFNNDLEDLVYRDNTRTPPGYYNAGKVLIQGIEYEVEFEKKAFSIVANYTFQKPDMDETSGYTVKNDQVYNIPNHSANAIINIAPLYNSYKDFWVNLGVQYLGERESPIGQGNPTYENYDINNVEPEVVLLNAGIKIYRLMNDDINLGVHVYNLLDEKWSQGGSVKLPYEQPGRWFFVKLTYKI